MKILVICQYYYPEPFRLPDICSELVKQGHEVTVVTGVPNYPMGKIYPGYGHRQKRNEVIDGVKVHRCFTIGRRSGPLFRMLNYYSYPLSSSRYVAKMKEEYDVVFVNQLSPIMMADAAIKYKKKHGTRLVMYCLDMWPESLTAGGIGTDSAIYRHYRKVSAKIYRQADELLISSKSFRKYIVDEFGIADEKIKYMPQYSEELFTPETCSKAQDENIDLLFAGNIGTVQSVETIVRAAAATRDIENLRWHIVGDGSDLENCKKLAEELGVESITFYGRKPIEEMPKYYSMADAMLITMEVNDSISRTLPGKVQTYMAAGKPIIGAINGEAADVISEANCGLCTNAENSDGLAELVREFCSERKITEYGENSRSYYVNVFAKDAAMRILEESLSR